MARGLSDAALAELYAANTGGTWLTLLTVTHASFGATLRYVNDHANIVSGGDTYTALAFTAKLPADRDSPVSATIVLDNVDLATIASFRAITEPALVTVEVIRQSAPDTILASWPFLRLVSAQLAASAVVLELAADLALDEGYPGTTFTPLLFPAGFDR